MIAFSFVIIICASAVALLAAAGGVVVIEAALRGPWVQPQSQKRHA